LGLQNVVSLLEETLSEEKKADDEFASALPFPRQNPIFALCARWLRPATDYEFSS